MRGMGIRPSDKTHDSFKGRVSWGETDLRGAAVLGCVYALSGQSTAKQLPLWCYLVQRLMSSGLPFILGGDWQVHPDEVRRSDMLRILDAEVVCTGLPTNVVSGNELDLFVVSRCLLSAGYSVELETGGSFSPHVAVRLSIHVPKDDGATRRLQQPRLLPIDRPIGPLMVPQYRVDWANWEHGKSGQGDGEQQRAETVPP